MAPSKTPVVRLLHIIDEAEAINHALTGVLRMDFEDPWILQRAVEHGRVIISEAAKTLPLDLKDNASDIAWRKIETMGNFLRHEYREVDPELIWSIVQDNLPGLLDAARQLFQQAREAEPV